MSKKKVAAILLFIFLSLFMFSYANPNEFELVEDDGISNDNLSNEVNNLDNSDEELNNVLEENTEEDADDNNVIINNVNNGNVPVVNNGNNNQNNDQGQAVNPTRTVKAPSISLTPNKVVILMGTSYNVMSGVVVDSDENLKAVSDVNDTSSLKAGNHTINYSVTNSNGDKASAKRTIVVVDPDADNDGDGFTNGEEFGTEYDYEDFDSHPDTKAPIIELIGNDKVIVFVGNEYKEDGVKITLDSHDQKTKVDNVKVIGTVDSNVVDTYVITYSITDIYNKTATVTRTVYVKEDKNGNKIPDDEEEKYTITFSYGEHGKLDGVLEQKDVLIDLTFDEAGIEIPEVVPDKYYVIDKWTPSTPADETVVTGNMEFAVSFKPEHDVNGNNNPDELDNKYTVEFKNVENDDRGSISGTLKYENILEKLSFESAKIVVPATTPKNSYYEFKGWKLDGTENTNLLSSEDLKAIVVNSNLVYVAVFGPKNDVNGNGIADEEETYKLTVNYVYSKDIDTVFDSKVINVVYNTSYEVKSPVIEKYVANPLVVEGTLTEEKNLTVKVVYSPINDRNNNGIPDEDDNKYTVEFVSGSNGNISGTLKYENVLEGLTFDEAGIIIPELVPDTYYVGKWNITLSGNTKVTDNVKYNAIFTPENDENDTGIPDELETYKLTVNYVYSKATDEVFYTEEHDVVWKLDYSFRSRIIENYVANPLVVEGTLTDKENKTVEVVYSPITDENNNGIPDEEEAKYTITFSAGEHGKFVLPDNIDEENSNVEYSESTITYKNILTGLSFENAGIVIPTISVDDGYVKAEGVWNPTLVLTVNGNVTYTAQYVVDPATVQKGINVVVKPGMQLQFNQDAEVNVKSYLLVYRVYSDDSVSETPLNDDEYEVVNFSTSVTPNKYTLTVKDGEFTDTTGYEIIPKNETAYDTQFSVVLNDTGKYTKYTSTFKWDGKYPSTEVSVKGKVFLEITETYNDYIDLGNITVEYTDGTKKNINLDNDVKYNNITGLIRWGNYSGKSYSAPVYKTQNLSSSLVKYVTINYTNTSKNESHYVKFEYKDGEFKAIAGE